MAAQAPDGDSKQSDKRPWLGPKSLRTVLRIGAAVGSVWIVGAALTAIWPVADRVAPALPSTDEPDSLAPNPSQR